MMRKDLDKIRLLIKKNEYFFSKGDIKNNEYAENCLLFAERIDIILKESDRKAIKDFLEDEFSLPKFKLSVSILKAIPN